MVTALLHRFHFLGPKAIALYSHFLRPWWLQLTYLKIWLPWLTRLLVTCLTWQPWLQMLRTWRLLRKAAWTWYVSEPGLCNNTITEPDIDMDVEILQFFEFSYWYWHYKYYSPLSLLVLILQDPTNKYQYWYCKVKWEDCPFDIGVEDCVEH